MKKILDTIKSFVLPRKMYKYHKMRFIYALFVYILTALLLLFSVNLSAKRLLSKDIKQPDMTNTNYEFVSGDDIPGYNFVKITKNRQTYYRLDMEDAGADGKTDNFRKVVNRTYKDNSTGGKLELTLVFYEDFDLYSTDTSTMENSIAILKENLFDLNGYINQKRNENTHYLLYIFTLKDFYYVYDLGKVVNESGEWVDETIGAHLQYAYDVDTRKTIYYLPNSENPEEIKLNSYGMVDTTLWTAVSEKGKTVEIDGVTYEASPRLRNRISNAIYNGCYIYTNMDMKTIIDEKINFSKTDNVNEVVSKLFDEMLASDVNIQKNMYSLFAIIFNVLIPILWVFIVWVISRISRLTLTKFKEYYAIGAISYIAPSFVGCILGFFIRFDKLILLILALELIFYIIVTFRINTDPELLKKTNNFDDNSDSNSQNGENTIPEKPKTNFKKVASDDVYTIE